MDDAFDAGSPAERGCNHTPDTPGTGPGATTIEIALAEQPLRATFLTRLRPDHRRTLAVFADLLESAALESFATTDCGEPFNLTMSRATLADLEALRVHQRDTVETWSHAQEETSPRLRTAMQRVHGLLLEAEDLLRGAVEEEARNREGDPWPG